MGKLLAYYLIIVGVLLLAVNTGFFNFSLLVQPLILPIMFIIYGAFLIITHFLDFGELGDAAKNIAGLIFFIIIVFNFGSILSRLFVQEFQAITPFLHEGGPYYTVEGSVLSAGFSDVSITSTVNSLKFEYYDESNNLVGNNTPLLSGTPYTLKLGFTKAYADFGVLTSLNETLIIESSFSDVSINNINTIKDLIVKNSFGDIALRTGELSGFNSVHLINSFGKLTLYVDDKTPHLIETSSAFGTVSNSLGVESSDYYSSAEKVHIIIKNSFGSVNILKG